MGKKEKKSDSALVNEVTKRESPVEKLDLSGLSESLRAPSNDKVGEALGKVLDLTFDERVTTAFEEAECLLPILRLLQRPVLPVPVDSVPEEIYAGTLLAVRVLGKMASRRGQAQRLLTADMACASVLLLQVKHPFWAVGEAALFALSSLAYYLDVVEALTSTTHAHKCRCVFETLAHADARLATRASQLIQVLARTYVSRHALCQLGLREVLTLARSPETLAELRRHLIQTLVAMTQSMAEAQAELLEAGFAEDLLRLLVHPNQELKLEAMRALATLANSSCLFARAVDDCGGVPVLHALVPKPERNPINKAPSPEGEEAPPPEPEPEPEPEPVEEDDLAPRGMDNWDDMDDIDEHDIQETFFHDSFGTSGPIQLNWQPKKRPKTPPPPKVQKQTRLELPAECVRDARMLPPLLQALVALLRVPELLEALLNKADEGYDPPWLQVLTFHLEVPAPPPPPPEPEPEPVPEPEEKPKSAAGSKKGGKSKTPPKTPPKTSSKSPPKTPPTQATKSPPKDPPKTASSEGDAPKVEEPKVLPGGRLPADERYPCNDVYLACLQGLVLMLKDVDTGTHLLKDEYDRFWCSYDFLDNLQKLMKMGDYSLLEQCLRVLQRMLVVLGAHAAEKLNRAGVKATLQELAKQDLKLPNLRSSLAEVLLSLSLKEMVPPHRPPTPPPASPPASPRLPSWREEPLRLRVEKEYADRHPPVVEEPDDDEDSEDDDPKKRRKKRGKDKGKKK